MAAAMMAGSQAWATPTTTILYNWSTSGTGVDGDDEEPTIWNATELATWADPNSTGGSFTISSNSLGLGFGTGGGNGSVYSRSRSFTIDGTAILTYDFVWYVYADYTNVERCFLNIGSNIELMAYPSTPASSYVKFNSVETTFKTAPTITSYAATLTVHLVVNTVTRVVTEFTIKQGETTLVSLTDLSDSQTTLSDGTSFSTIGLQAKTRASGHSVNSRLTSAKIQQTTQDIATYDYTVNYKDGDNIVKTVSGSLAEGTLIPVLSALDGDMTGYEGVHYLITGDAPSQAISTTPAENVIDIPVRRPYTISSLTIKKSYGGEEVDYITESNITESDSKNHTYTYVFPFCEEHDGHYYKATLVDGNFGENIEFTSYDQVVNKTIIYTLDESIVYYYDHSSTGKDITLSKGSSGVGNTKTMTIGALVKGYYEIMVNYSDHSRKPDGIKDGEDVVLNKSLDWNTPYTFILTDDATDLKVYKSSNMVGFDYILIKRVSHQTITAVDNLGYTFSSTLPLDFTGTTVEAYTAAYNSTTKKVDLNRVYKVPANTGLFIKGTADDIPVLTDDADAIGTNNLVAVSSTTTVAATDGGSNTNYVLALADKNDESQGVVFLKAAGTTVGAGKAYLQIPTASATAPQLMLSFGDVIATGINMVQSDGFKVNGYYDLQGRKVMNPKKGLYIVNGKKVVIK